MIKLPFALVVGALLATSSPASASSVIDNYNSVTKASQVIEPMNVENFGQAVSLQDGSVVFRATDVVVPTNQDSITFGRSLNPGSFISDELGGGTNFDSMPATPWELDIPHMRGVFDARYGGGWGSADQSRPFNRCTQIGDPPIVYGVGTFSPVQYAPGTYFSGITISIPGKGMESVKQVYGGSAPGDGQVYKGTTPSHWKLSCLASLKRGAGEGFRAVMPDGSAYYFDWFVSRTTGNVNDSTCSAASQNFYRSPESAAIGTFQGCWTTVAVPRVESFLYATEVIDRFGNKTEYKFDANSPFRLTSILYNGETIMSMQYSGDRLSQVSAGGQVWQYSYQGSGGSLSEVALPDGSRWHYDTPTALHSINWYEPLRVWSSCKVNVGTKTTSVAPGQGEASYVSMTSPSGATARFDLRKILHGTRHGEGNCYYQSVPGGGQVGPLVPYPSAYQSASLYKLTVSGPGIDTYIRSYHYVPGWDSPYESMTVVSDSAGKVAKYRFGFGVLHGKLLEEVVGTQSEATSQTLYTYLTDTQGQNFPQRVGIQFPTDVGMGVGLDTINLPLVERSTFLDGINFRWKVMQDCDGRYCIDSLVRPVKIERSSRPQ